MYAIRSYYVFEFDPAHNPVAFPSPRSWEFAHRALHKFADVPDLLTGSLQACVGPAAGIELSAFVENLDKLPDIDAIVRGEKVTVPRETDLQYAVAAALVGRAIRAKQESNPAEIFGNIRITSYNVCYTKLLRDCHASRFGSHDRSLVCGIVV